ncbi:hypothetical protein F183_A41970 [Bryobacterales bacterium F-183]|nr:hypothetical protein F183_A41970 [Bryobacterales bacterium F-183]
MVLFGAVAALLLVAYVGFKIVRFVTSVLIRILLFFLLLGIAAVVIFRLVAS